MFKKDKEGIFMECHKDEIARLEKQFEDKSLGEIEQELGITCYNNTDVGFGYLGMGKLPETLEEAMKIFDTSEVDELLSQVWETANMFTTTNVLRLDDWNNIEGIFDNVRCVNELYHPYIKNNLIYLETHDKDGKDKKIYTTYAVELRDAYSHLVKLLAYKDIYSSDNKVKINRQLERYLGHLEELLYDTYLRKIMIMLNSFLKKIDGRRELPEKKMKYAEQISQLRIMNDDITIKQKIEKYEAIIDDIEKDNYQEP
jgi:hypothetical protein